MGVLILAVRILLAAVFGVAALAKLHDAQGLRKSLVEFGVPAGLTFPLAAMLNLAELICAVALLWDRWAVTGAFVAMALLLVFTTVIAVNLLKGRAPDCHCFGQLSSSPVSWRTLVRNLALLAMAALVAIKAGKVHAGMPSLTAPWLAVGGLTAALGLTLWVLVQLFRQNGRLLLRVEAIEQKLNMDPRPESWVGLPVGHPAPDFELNLEDRKMGLQSPTQTGKPALLLFTNPDCPACKELQPELANWEVEYADRLIFVKIQDADRTVAQAYRVNALPGAVLVSNGKVASDVAAGADAIRTLVARASIPPPVKKGDRIPSVRLSDVNGNTLDLTSLRGRRALLLFWDPSCSFCQRMLPELRSWKRPEGAPEVVVISSGTVESNREQHLRVKVLVDPNLGWVNVFGVKGTPAAVVLDEEGRVASEVVTGAPAIFALAGAEVPAALAGWNA